MANNTTTATTATAASSTKANALTPAERATGFNAATRRYQQNYQVQSAADGATVSFVLPKSKLLSGCILEVTGILTASHASLTAFTPDVDAPFSYIQNVNMSYNSSFAPFNISGRALKDFNTTILTAFNTVRTASGRAVSLLPVVSSSGGTANAFKFFVNLPNMLNERDPVSLILLQSDETSVTLNVTLGTMNSIAPAASGFTFATSNVQVALMLDTFSIPALASQFPDISVLKLLQEQTFPVNVGENVIKLSTGRTYRKLGLQLNDSTGIVPLADSVVTSNFQLIFNQTTIPYNISPDMLMYINLGQYEGALNAGRWVFDFSDNGQPNYGGSRDYIDTTGITEFWFKFTSSTAGFAKVWSESLVRLS